MAEGGSLVQRLTRLLDRLVTIRAPASRPLRVVLAVVGAAVFALILLAAVANLPDDLDGLRWSFVLAAAFLGVPLTLAVNGQEYRLMARLAGVTLGYRTAWRVSLAGSAANLLPVPGSVLVRVAHLRRRDVSYRAITHATAVVAATYVGIALVLAGLVGATQRPLAGLLALAAGLLVGVAGLAAARPLGTASPRLVVELVLVEAASIAAGAVRLGLLLAALDAWSLVGALSLVLADVLAAVIGFLPGGLGVRELLAAVLGPLADVPASVSVVATALDRLVTIVVVGTLAVVLSRRPTR